MDPRDFELSSFVRISKMVDEFEYLLNKHQIHLKNGSRLEHACLVLKEFLSQYDRVVNGTVISNPIDDRKDLSEALGAYNLIQLCLEHESHPDFLQLVPHLAKHGEGNIIQTVPSPSSDQIANKMFELRLALACMKTGENLYLDDPNESSGGTNPDILIDMPDKKTWGFACKVIHGDAPMTLFENLEKGVDQIEKSVAHTGLVCISLKNKLPHDEIFKAQRIKGEVVYQETNWQEARGIASSYFQKVVYEMTRHVGEKNIRELFKGKKALPAISSAIDTTGLSKLNGKPILSIYSYLHTCKLGEISAEYVKIMDFINSGLAAGRPLSLQKP